MDYLPTLGETWPHSRGNVGNYSLHGSCGNERFVLWSTYGTVKQYPANVDFRTSSNYNKSGWMIIDDNRLCLRIGFGLAMIQWWYTLISSGNIFIQLDKMFPPNHPKPFRSLASRFKMSWHIRSIIHTKQAMTIRLYLVHSLGIMLASKKEWYSSWWLIHPVETYARAIGSSRAKN